MRETQASIYQWAVGTFGEAKSNYQIFCRAVDEIFELQSLMVEDDEDPKIVEEIADVFIVLMQIPERLGLDLGEAIDRKMAINRAREWKTNGDGTGQHVEGVRG